MDERPLPWEDPALRGVWEEMDPEERLLLLAYQDEPVPAEVSEKVRQMYRHPYPDAS